MCALQVFKLLLLLSVYTKIGAILLNPEIGANTANVGNSGCLDIDLPCDSGDQCVTRSSWCDTEPDCEDESDEAYCAASTWLSRDPNECEGTHFLCKNGKCFPLEARCDGVVDCTDGSDEVLCGENGAAKVHATTTTISSTSTTRTTTPRPPYASAIEEEGFNEIDTHVISLEPTAVPLGVKWLLSFRRPNYGWGHGTARALITLGLTVPEMFTKDSEESILMKKQFQVLVAVDLLRNRTQRVTLSRLSQYINGMLATCQDPRNFHGMDLVSDLRYRTSLSYVSTGRPDEVTFVNPIALLTLCLVGESTQSDVHKLQETLRVRAEEQRWFDMQAIAIMALSCIVEDNNFGKTYAQSLHTAVTNLQSRMSPVDGNFGNIYSTALAVQALFSALPAGSWNPEPSLLYLKSHQLDSGSFGDLLSTYFILPALAGKSLTSLRNVPCPVHPTAVPGLIPIETLLDWTGPRHYVRYSLYYGYPVELSHSILLHVPLNTTFFNIMRLAEHTDPKFKFQYEIEPDNSISVYAIGNVPNDAERSIYWQLFAHLNGRHRGGIERHNGAHLRPYTHDVKQLIPKDNDHIAFWYRAISNNI